MKRLTGITAVIVGIILFSSASSVSWEGRAVIAEKSLFPSDGRYARSRVFSRGEMVDVYNPANETKTSVVIVGPSDVSGVLIMLSPQAAAELSISEGYDAIVRVNKKQLYTEPSILPGTDTAWRASAADPDTNPRAAVESRAPAGFLSEQGAAQVAAGTIPVPEQPSSIALTPGETTAAPVPIITDEPVVRETGEAIPLVQAQSNGVPPVVTDVPVLQTRIEPTRSQAIPEESVPVPPDENGEPILYTTTITAPPTAEPELSSAAGTAETETHTITDTPVPDFTDVPELYSSAVATETETQAITDVPAPEPHDEPEMYTHSVSSGETETGTPADEPAVTVHETTDIGTAGEETSLAAAPDTSDAEFSSGMELTKTAEDIHPSISVDIGDGEFILIPADMLPPEVVHAMGTATAESGEEGTALTSNAPTAAGTPVPSAKTEANVKASSGAEAAAGLASASRRTLSIPEELSSLCITEFERNSYYIQLASLHDVQNITTIVSAYGRSYPIKLHPSTADTCQVLVGPLSKDEYGTVLDRFRNHGFSDAFVRGIN